MRKRLPGFILIVCVLALWELSAAMEWVDPVEIPRVSTIFVSWYKSLDGGPLLKHLLPSLGRIFGGFFIASSIAVPLGLLMGTVPFIYRLLEPITEFIRPIPSSAYVPIAILFFGIDNSMKIFIVSLGCFFPILLNTYSGVMSVDPVLIDTGRTFGLTRLQALRQIVLPAALPNILTGMRISLGLGLIIVVVAEMITGNSGVGYFILDRQRVFRVSEMFAGIFTLGLLGFSLNFIFLHIERYFLRWRKTAETV